MNSLAQLQRALQSHIVDGDPALADSIDSSATVSAATRLRIYSDAYRLRLIEALQANYPVLEKLIGADEFSRLAQLYLAAHPSRHFSIRWFGHELASFLIVCNEYSDKPWLAELAEWEWKIASAFDARDAILLTVDDLTKVAPEDWPALRFAVHPSMQRIALATNVAAIAKAAGNDAPLPNGAQLEQAREWLIWRRDLVVRFRSLDPTEAAAIDTVRSGATFGELCEVIAEHIDAEAVPGKAAELLRIWIDEQLLARSDFKVDLSGSI